MFCRSYVYHKRESKHHRWCHTANKKENQSVINLELLKRLMTKVISGIAFVIFQHTPVISLSSRL